jgi:type IV pilus biogenesis protein PilP
MDLQRQIAVLEQQLKIAELKKQIREADDTGTKESGNNPVAPPAPASALGPSVAATPSVPPPLPLPQVVSISGLGNHLAATLRLAAGGLVIAYPATGLPGGLTVHDVSADGVHVMKGGELIPLPFAGADAQATAAPAPQVVQLPAFSAPPVGPGPFLHGPSGP